MLYVLAIKKNVSGGSETLHQFAAKVKKAGGNVRMFYPDSDGKNTLPEKFKIYDLDIADDIVDDSSNILLVPETETKYLYRYKKIRKVIWWLSLDNYYGYASITGLIRSAQRHGIPHWLYWLYCPVVFLKKKLTLNYYRFRKKDWDIFHLYNCEYVRSYLEHRGITHDRYLYLCGPIRRDYFLKRSGVKRRNIIIYNPKKNIDFTKLVIKDVLKKRKDLKFVPIQNMTPKEIVNLMDESKVYMDFGQFPGPERIPREAVMRGCNIITSTYGSAKNDIDVLVPREFKIDAKKENISKISESIEELVDNYSHYVNSYDSYRDKVIKQWDIFDENIVTFMRKFDI